MTNHAQYILVGKQFERNMYFGNIESEKISFSTNYNCCLNLKELKNMDGIAIKPSLPIEDSS